MEFIPQKAEEIFPNIAKIIIDGQDYAENTPDWEDYNDLPGWLKYLVERAILCPLDSNSQRKALNSFK